MLVHHGSPCFVFTKAQPRRNIRRQLVGGEMKVIFDDCSFHATPHLWIALAYTYSREAAQKGLCNMGVDLYNDTKEVAIYSSGRSLEEALKILYGNGGYVYTFTSEHFTNCEGLGTLEVICRTKVEPVAINHIHNPVRALKSQGVKFILLPLKERN